MVKTVCEVQSLNKYAYVAIFVFYFFLFMLFGGWILDGQQNEMLKLFEF